MVSVSQFTQSETCVIVTHTTPAGPLGLVGSPLTAIDTPATVGVKHAAAHVLLVVVQPLPLDTAEPVGAGQDQVMVCCCVMLPVSPEGQPSDCVTVDGAGITHCGAHVLLMVLQPLTLDTAEPVGAGQDQDVVCCCVMPPN